MRKPAKHTVTVLFSLLISLLVVISVMSYKRIKRLDEAANWVNQTQVIRNTLWELLSTLKDAESGQRSFLLTNDSVFLESYLGAEQRLTPLLEAADSLTRDNSLQHKKFQTLKDLIAHRMLLQQSIVEGQGHYLRDSMLREAKNKMDVIREHIVLMLELEHTHLLQRTKEKERWALYSPIFSFLLSFLAIFSIVLFFIWLQREVRLRISTQKTVALQDIERKRIEESEKQLEAKVQSRTEELRERNLFVQTLLDSSPDLIVVLDKELRFLTLNKKAADAYYQFMPVNIIGKKVDEVTPFIRETPSYTHMQEALQGKHITTADFQSPFSGKHFELNFVPIRNDHEVYAVMISTHDISDTVNAVQALEQANLDLEKRKNFVETIIESSKEWIGVFDKDLRVISMNKAGWERMNVKPEDMIGKTLQEIFPNADSSKAQSNLRRALNGEVVHNDSYQSSVAGRFVETYMTPLRDPHGEIYAVLSIARDVTDMVLKQKEVEAANEELRIKNLEMEEANTELASFSHVASHDLKEPLRKIRTFINRILKGQTFNETTRDYFMRMVAATERMQNLIDSLLEFSRNSATGLTFEPCDLNSILAESKAYLEEGIREKQVVISHEQLPTVNGVPVQLTQLFINLLGNAIKYSRAETPPHIKISSTRIEGKNIEHPLVNKQKEYYQLNFADNGIGFDPQYSQRIFGFFQRLHDRKEFEGSGVGLAICKKIASNHNGFIAATAKPGEGATFSVYLPV